MTVTRADLARFLAKPGVDLYGFADMRGVLGGSWAGWPWAISIAQELLPECLAGVEEGPTPAYHQAYGDVNASLTAIALDVEAFLRQAGYQAKAFPATVPPEELVVDLTALVQHKTVATRAGLGWIGKNALLVTKRFGPRVRLVSVFTDMELDAAVPVEKSGCGSCRHCVEACPAGALHGAHWQAGMPRQELVDARACCDMAERLLSERVGVHNAVCGICIAVCPFAGLGRNQ
ncbi:MAG: 4Fe-4S double cluster binding domain-containing protein [Anaerolineae bacterium]